MSFDSQYKDYLSINKDEFVRCLETKVLGHAVLEIHETVDSTSFRARKLAAAGAAEGSLVLAETQTAGRGRLGRAWHSPPGKNVYFSLILRPILPPEQIQLITLTAGLSAAEALTGIIGRSPDLKWPNDLLLDQKKIIGILAELELISPGAPYVVLGMGLNVNAGIDDIPPDLRDKAGSLFMATGEKYDRSLVLARLLSSLEKYYHLLIQGQAHRIIELYRRACNTLGTRVRVSSGPRVTTGLAVDVDDNGGLMVRPDGSDEVVVLNAGEVSLSGNRGR